MFVFVFSGYISARRASVSTSRRLLPRDVSFPLKRSLPPRYTPAGFSCKVGMKQTRVLKLSLASGLRSFESAAAGRDSRLVDNRRAVASTGRSTTSKRIARADGRLFQMLIDDVIRRSRPSQRRSCVASGRASLARPRVELATLGWALFARSLACRE